MQADDNFDSIPNDWWQRIDVCKSMGADFTSHVIGLFIEMNIDGQLLSCNYTGFLVKYRGELFWFTAGHVVNQIHHYLTAYKDNIVRMDWLDGGTIQGAESVIVHNREYILNYSYSPVDEDIFDFGAIVITGLDAYNILSNPHILPITEVIWKNPNNDIPEGYFLVGYPNEVGEYVRKRFETEIRCLPISSFDHTVDPIAYDQDSFYGQILPFVDADNEQPNDIGGMSGGPIFSVERTWIENNKLMIRYRLVGIQRSWTASKRLIRAEPISRIISLLDQLINNVSNHLPDPES